MCDVCYGNQFHTTPHCILPLTEPLDLNCGTCGACMNVYKRLNICQYMYLRVSNYMSYLYDYMRALHATVCVYSYERIYKDYTYV